MRLPQGRGLHTNLLTATPDEAALAVVCFLATARDLHSPQLTCRRFNIKCIASVGGGAAVAETAVLEAQILGAALRCWRSLEERETAAGLHESQAKIQVLSLNA